MRKKILILLPVIILSSFSLMAQVEEGPSSPVAVDPAGNDNSGFLSFTLPGGGNQQVALSLQLLIFLTILTLSPTIVVLMTSFLRIAIVFDFIRRAISLQQVPPNSVLMGVALFITIFIMWPTFNQVYEEAFVPYRDGQMNTEQFIEEGMSPVRLFMFRQLDGDTSNIELFMSLTGDETPETLQDVPTYVLIPSFVLNELTIAFKIGIWLYIPFIVIDMIVASVLMSMGMIMLPPVMISMPFKLILFVLVDGWTLITRQVVQGFYT